MWAELCDESEPDFLVICSGFVESQLKMIVIVKFLRDIEVLSLKELRVAIQSVYQIFLFKNQIYQQYNSR